MHWLSTQPSNLKKAQLALERIFAESMRAEAVINWIRAIIKRAPQRTDHLAINEMIQEVMTLAHSEATRNGVDVQTQLAEDMPAVVGDSVQLQQVIMNLVINGIEAMSGVGAGPRDLTMITARAGSGGALVAIKDSGPGLTVDTSERVFDAFFTTKPGGLGASRSLVRSSKRTAAACGRVRTLPVVPSSNSSCPLVRAARPDQTPCRHSNARFL